MRPRRAQARNMPGLDLGGERVEVLAVAGSLRRSHGVCGEVHVGGHLEKAPTNGASTRPEPPSVERGPRLALVGDCSDGSAMAGV